MLERAARLLYQDWFVHLRFPGHEHVTITDGVPEGWEKKTLTAIAEFRLGKILAQKQNRGDLLPEGQRSFNLEAVRPGQWWLA